MPSILVAAQKSCQLSRGSKIMQCEAATATPLEYKTDKNLTQSENNNNAEKQQKQQQSVKAAITFCRVEL